MLGIAAFPSLVVAFGILTMQSHQGG